MPNLRFIASLLGLDKNGNSRLKDKTDSLKRRLEIMRRSGVGGRAKPHKPLLLLAVLELFESGVLQENRVPFTPPLIEAFNRLFSAVAREHDWAQPSLPYFHLRSDGFWKHKPVRGNERAYAQLTKPGGGSKRIKEVIEYAYFDNDAYAVISDPVGRQIIRDFILETFFSAEEQEKLRQVMNGRSAAPADEQPLSAIQTASARTGAEGEAPGATAPVGNQLLGRLVDDEQQALSSVVSGEVQPGDTAAPEPLPEAEDTTQPFEYGDPPIQVLTRLALHQEAQPLYDARDESDASLFNASEELRSEGAPSASRPHLADLSKRGFQPDTPIQELGLSARTYNALKRAGVAGAGQLMALSESALWAIRNIGVNAMAEIRQVRARLGPVERAVIEPDEAISVETPQVGQSDKNDTLLLLGVADDGDLLQMPLSRCAASAIPSDDWAQIFVALKSRYRTALPTRPSPPLDRPTYDLHRLGLNMRAANALQRAGVTSVAQVARLTLADLVAVRNFGLDSFSEVLTALRSRPEVIEAADREEAEARRKEIEVRRARDALVAALRDFAPIPLVDKLVQAGILELADLEQWTFEDLLRRAKLTMEEAQLFYCALQPKGFFAPRPPSENLLVQACDLEYLKRLGIPLHQIAIKRLGLPQDLEFRLARLGLDTVGKLAGMNKVVLGEWLGRDTEQALDLLTSRLSLYLDHVAKQTTWDAEIAETAPCPVHLMQLRETTLESLIDAWLEQIKDARSREVLALRYGLSGSERQTLNEIGKTLDLTRERVRQLQQKAVKRLLAAPDDPLLSALLWTIEQEMERRGGLMSLDQIGEFVEMLLEIGEVERDGALQLLLELRGSRFHEVDGNRWILQKYPKGLAPETADKLADLLMQNHAPMTLEQIYARLCDTAWQARCSNHFSVTVEWAAACLSTDDRFEEREDGSWGLARWSRSRTDEIVMALRKLGEPSHYTAITRVANALLPPEQQASSRYVHALLQRKSDLFVRTGSGVYGLAEWGHGRARYYKLIAQEFLERKGEPQPLDAIFTAVCAERQVSRESLAMLLGTNPLFKTYPGGRFGLAAWAETVKPPDDDQTDEFIESLKDKLLLDLLSHDNAPHKMP